jgi:hypothetical protein
VRHGFTNIAVVIDDKYRVRALRSALAITPEMLQQSTRRGVLLVRAGTEPPGGCRTRSASLELCREQVSDIVEVQICRVGYCRLCVAHIPVGYSDEGVEFALVIASSANEHLSVDAKIGKLIGRKAKGHSSRSCAAVIRCRKLGG